MELPGDFPTPTLESEMDEAKNKDGTERYPKLTVDALQAATTGDPMLITVNISGNNYCVAGTLISADDGSFVQPYKTSWGKIEPITERVPITDQPPEGCQRLPMANALTLEDIQPSLRHYAQQIVDTCYSNNSRFKKTLDKTKNRFNQSRGKRRNRMAKR